MSLPGVVVPPVMLVAVVVAVAAAVLVVAKIPRALAASGSARFTSERLLALSPDNQRLVRRHLATVRRARLLGGIGGLAVGVAVSEAAGGGLVLLTTSWFFAAVAGYFVGSLVGAWRSGTSATGTNRSASLRVRQRSDLVPTWVTQATYGTAVGTVAFLIASLFAGSGVATASAGVRWLVAASAVLGAVWADFGSRRVAWAARPSAAQDVTAAFDAVTQLSACAVATAGLSLGLWLMSWSAFAALPRSAGHDALAIASVLVGVAALFASPAVWLGSRRDGWQRNPDSSGQ